MSMNYARELEAQGKVLKLMILTRKSGLFIAGAVHTKHLQNQALSIQLELCMIMRTQSMKQFSTAKDQ